jgi:hypothetical protein
MKVKVKQYGSRAQLIAVENFKQASDVCQKFIDDDCLGSSEWEGGEVYDDAGKQIATVSYNGRVWEGKGYPGKEIKIDEEK